MTHFFMTSFGIDISIISFSNCMKLSLYIYLPSWPGDVMSFVYEGNNMEAVSETGLCIPN